MATLKGNLKDFNITNILPIIKAENQTGILSVKDKDNVIRITFLEGQVVYGEFTAAKDIKRLRDTLLSNRLMTRDAWKQLQEQHTSGLESIWNVLQKMVPPDTASWLYRRQVLDAVFALMRLTKGDYNFTSEKVDYPEKLVQPMDVDFLLMDGARIADEWSIMEKKLPSPTAILRKAIMADDSADASTSMKMNALDQTGDFTESIEYEVLKERGIELTDEEISVLSVVGMHKSVNDIMDSANLSYFDAGNAIASLLQKKILTPLSRREVAAAIRPEEKKKGSLSAYLVLLVALAVAGASGYYRYITLPERIESAKALVESVFESKTQKDLHNLLYRFQVYYSRTGRHATNPDELKTAGLANECLLTDRWGNRFQYALKGKYFTLYSMGPDPFARNDDIYLRLR